MPLGPALNLQAHSKLWRPALKSLDTPPPLPTNQSWDPQLFHWPGHKAPGQLLPHLTEVAKVAATPPCSPVLINRSYGDHSRMTPWGQDSSCGTRSLGLGISPIGHLTSSPHGRQQQVVADNLTVSAWRVTKCVH